MRDAITLLVLVVAFAALVTAHVTLAIGLARRGPPGRGVFALIVAPLAPLWGWRERMRIRGAVWVASAVVYAVALGLAMR
jgi:hypothetical protein